MNEKEFRDTIPNYDERGIVINDEVLMWNDEKGFIRQSIQEIHDKIKFSSVIEIGFGLGYTATKFQELGVEQHTIIEPNIVLYSKAVEWKKQYPDKNIRIINNRWQNYKGGTLEEHDLLYYDAYEMVTPQETLDFKNYNHKWYAHLCVTGDKPPEGFFVFENEGTKYIQRLTKK